MNIYIYMHVLYIYIYIYIYIYTNISREYKDVHSFYKSISPKMNILERLEFEPAYYNAAVNHWAMVTFPPRILKWWKMLNR